MKQKRMSFLKVFLLSALISASSAATVSAAYDGTYPEVWLNGNKLETDAFISEGCVYLPLRGVSETLGFDIDWSANDRTITVSKPGKDILFDLNESKVTVNDHTYFISYVQDESALGEFIIINNTSYISKSFAYENFGVRSSMDFQSGKISITSIDENAIDIKTEKETFSNDNTDITLQYPQISGLETEAVQNDINALFKKEAEDSKNEGLRAAEEFAEYTAEHAGNPNKCETYFDYRIKYNENDILSVIFIDYQYAGGAHGTTFQSSYTINLKTGEKYELRDFFADNADYVAKINDSVKRQLDERKLTQALFKPFETIDPNHRFYIGENGITVYFQQYDILPYAAGIQEFSTEFSELKDLLKPGILPE